MERARNRKYDNIGLMDTTGEIDAAIPAGDSNHPDRLLRRDLAITVSPVQHRNRGQPGRGAADRGGLVRVA
jgi:hypothetical protein